MEVEGPRENSKNDEKTIALRILKCEELLAKCYFIFGILRFIFFEASFFVKLFLDFTFCFLVEVYEI